MSTTSEKGKERVFVNAASRTPAFRIIRLLTVLLAALTVIILVVTHRIERDTDLKPSAFAIVRWTTAVLVGATLLTALAVAALTLDVVRFRVTVSDDGVVCRTAFRRIASSWKDVQNVAIADQRVGLIGRRYQRVGVVRTAFGSFSFSPLVVDRAKPRPRFRFSLSRTLVVGPNGTWNEPRIEDNDLLGELVRRMPKVRH